MSVHVNIFMNIGGKCSNCITVHCYIYSHSTLQKMLPNTLIYFSIKQSISVLLLHITIDTWYYPSFYFSQVFNEIMRGEKYAAILVFLNNLLFYFIFFNFKILFSST